MSKFKYPVLFLVLLALAVSGILLSSYNHLPVESLGATTDVVSIGGEFDQGDLKNTDNPSENLQIFTHSASDPIAAEIYNLSQNKPIYIWNKDASVTQASLEKLYTIGFAITQLNLDDNIELTQETLDIVPEGSSLADIVPGIYRAEEIFTGMLIPSGNDAAYAVAVAVGKKLGGKNQNSIEALDTFRNKMLQYLQAQGYNSTKYSNPAGFSRFDTTSVTDITAQSAKIIHDPWFRSLVKQPKVNMKLSNGLNYSWNNTNEFLNENSKFYNSKIQGVKTGTFGSSHNLVSLYRDKGREYILVVLGAPTNNSRYVSTIKMISSLNKLK